MVRILLYIGWCFLDLKWTFYRALLPIYIKNDSGVFVATSRARLYLQIHVRYLYCNFTCAMTQFSSFYIMITALSQCIWYVPITLLLYQQTKYWICRCITDNCFGLKHILIVFATCCHHYDPCPVPMYLKCFDYFVFISTNEIWDIQMSHRQLLWFVTYLNCICYVSQVVHHISNINL